MRRRTWRTLRNITMRPRTANSRASFGPRIQRRGPAMGDASRMAYRMFRSFVVDPATLVRHWRGLPYYFRNAREYNRSAGDRFRIRVRDLYYASHERFAPAGT